MQSGQRPHVPENLCLVPGSREHEHLPAVQDYIACMGRAWAQDAAARPAFEDVVKDLEAIDVSVTDYLCAHPMFWLRGILVHFAASGLCMFVGCVQSGISARRCLVADV